MGKCYRAENGEKKYRINRKNNQLINMMKHIMCSLFFENLSPKIIQRQLYASWVSSAIAGLKDAELAFRYQ